VKPDIVAELRGIADRDARLSVPMILSNIEGAEAARGALSAAFADPAVTELRALNLGDGGRNPSMDQSAREHYQATVPGSPLKGPTISEVTQPP
jgi:hypothetical protein